MDPTLCLHSEYLKLVLHYIQSKEEAYVVLKYLEDMIQEKAVC